MAEVAYATFKDVEDILDPDIELPSPTDREGRNLATALMEATDAVIGYLEREFDGPAVSESDPVPDDVPGAVRRVVARVALRGFVDEPANPGAESEVNLMGPFSHTINWSKESQARSLYLTEAEKQRIDRFKRGYSGAASHVPMSGAGDCLYAP